jgi:hypothetical protein
VSIKSTNSSLTRPQKYDWSTPLGFKPRCHRTPGLGVAEPHFGAASQRWQ